MSLSTSISVLLGTTAFTPTGGTATTFVNDGKGMNGKKVLVESSQSDPVLRKKIITDVVIGAVSPIANALAKLHRENIVVHQPFVDSNGVAYNLPANISISYHPSMTSAQRTTHRNNVMAIATDSELGQLKDLIND